MAVGVVEVVTVRDGSDRSGNSGRGGGGSGGGGGSSRIEVTLPQAVHAVGIVPGLHVALPRPSAKKRSPANVVGVAKP